MVEPAHVKMEAVPQFEDESSSYVAVQHDDGLSDEESDSDEDDCGDNSVAQLNFVPEDVIEQSSRGKIYTMPAGVFVNGRRWMSIHWLRCSIYAAAFDSVTLKGKTKTYCEDWYTCVFVKLCESGINTHYEYLKRYEDGSINTLLRLNGYTEMNESSLKSIYMFMLDPNTEIYSMNYQHRDDALVELTQFGYGLSERNVDYLKLKNAVYTSALFAERLRPRKWTNAVKNKLLNSNINNKETLKGLIDIGSLNTRLQTKGYNRMHPVSMRFLRMALQELSRSIDCLWRNDVHDRPTYVDIAGPLGLLCGHMEKVCIPEYEKKV